jgi:hypothetical protein
MHRCGPELGPSYQQVGVPCGDRWRVQRRLQELAIPAWCPPNGCLQVEVSNCVAAIQLRSVVRQFLAPRTELAAWLERCWEAPLANRTD